MVRSIDYNIVTAFSTDASGGNPAAVVFLDAPLLDQEYETIAINLNQPITMFVTPPNSENNNPQIKRLAIRFFLPVGAEQPLCGHGLLAASRAIFDQPHLVTADTNALEFETRRVGIVRAEKDEDGIFEIKLPTTDPKVVSQEEFDRLAPAIFSAFGSDVHIKHIAHGQGEFDSYLLVVFDENDNLKGRQVNANALLATDYIVNIFTTESSREDELFVSRMFAPKALPIPEDHVCGSAHCLLGPYWYKTKGIQAGSVVKAKQVSKRGGDLRLVLEGNGYLRVGGNARMLSEGKLWI